MRTLTRSFRLAALCAAGAALLGGSAAAQAPGMPYDWNGFYLGAEAGYAFSGLSDDDWHLNNANYFNTLGATVLGSSFSLEPDGFVGGGLAGYNYQMGRFVLGAEVSLDGTTYNDRVASPWFPTIDTFRTEVDWIATAAGRVGFATGRLLVYAKGGYAGGEVNLSLHDSSAGIDADLDRWAHGYVAGAGFEYALSGRFTVGIGYSHIGLFIDNAGMDCPNCGTGVGFGTPNVDADIGIDKITARATIHLR